MSESSADHVTQAMREALDIATTWRQLQRSPSGGCWRSPNGAARIAKSTVRALLKRGLLRYIDGLDRVEPVIAQSSGDKA
jgi:hypothetical protein